MSTYFSLAPRIRHPSPTMYFKWSLWDTQCESVAEHVKMWQTGVCVCMLVVVVVVCRERSRNLYSRPPTVSCARLPATLRYFRQYLTRPPTSSTPLASRRRGVALPSLAVNSVSARLTADTSVVGRIHSRHSVIMAISAQNFSIRPNLLTLTWLRQWHLKSRPYSSTEIMTMILTES